MVKKAIKGIEENIEDLAKIENEIAPVEEASEEIEEAVEKVLDEEENVEELILAIKPGIEGETTALYISKILAGTNIKISKIAHGIPIGADMEYIDALTLERALEDRKLII